MIQQQLLHSVIALVFVVIFRTLSFPSLGVQTCAIVCVEIAKLMCTMM